MTLLRDMCVIFERANEGPNGTSGNRSMYNIQNKTIASSCTANSREFPAQIETLNYCQAYRVTNNFRRDRIAAECLDKKKNKKKIDMKRIFTNTPSIWSVVFYARISRRFFQRSCRSARRSSLGRRCTRAFAWSPWLPTGLPVAWRAARAAPRPCCAICYVVSAELTAPKRWNRRRATWRPVRAAPVVPC